MSVFRQSLRRARDGSLPFVRMYSAPASRAVSENKQKYIPSEGTYPKGFLAGTAHAGVKISNTKYDDVTMIASERPCNAAAVFTRNAFKAAPVQLSKSILAGAGRSHVRGVIVNSGCANAVTGDTGSKDARSMAVRTDECFSSTEPAANPSTLVMSTGVIGQKLPIDRILNAIPKAHAALGSTHQHWLNAANAICTTDTFPKLISRTFTLPSQPETTYSIAGITKGAGMIHPNMATLLGIVCTDAAANAAWLQTQLKTAVDASFNRISIDGDTSTNDSVVLLANGAASSGHVLGEPHDEPSRADAAAFQSVLSEFMIDLAQLVVRDGEGATKFVTIRVLGSDTLASAVLERVAMSIARSPLVKTALYGKDANWGRILCAIGYSPDALDATAEEHGVNRVIALQHTSVSFVPTDDSPELTLLRRGEPEEVDETRAQEILDMDELEILVDLDDMDSSHTASKKSCRVWTCDFSHEYVTINGDYRT